MNLLIKDGLKKIKETARGFGFDPKAWEASVRLSLSKRRFQSLGYPPLEGYDVTRHYGDQVVDESHQFIEEGFIGARLDFIREALGPEEIAGSSFADIGDSNGVFLKSLGKRGLSVNVSPEVLKNVSGLETLLGGLPRLPLADGQVDYALCFETIEHLHDPIGGLKELARVAKKGVFASIPRMKRTQINPYWPDRSRPALEQHVMEFSDGDFRKLLSYAGLRVRAARVHNVFSAPRTPGELLAWAAWGLAYGDVLCGCFKSFNIYLLVREE